MGTKGSSGRLLPPLDGSGITLTLGELTPPESRIGRGELMKRNGQRSAPLLTKPEDSLLCWETDIGGWNRQEVLSHRSWLGPESLLVPVGLGLPSHTQKEWDGWEVSAGWTLRSKHPSLGSLLGSKAWDYPLPPKDIWLLSLWKPL